MIKHALFLNQFSGELLNFYHCTMIDKQTMVAHQKVGWLTTQNNLEEWKKCLESLNFTKKIIYFESKSSH